MAAPGIHLLPALQCLDDINRIKGAGALDRVGPDQQLDIDLARAPIRLVMIFLLEILDEEFGQWIGILLSPPPRLSAVSSAKDRCAYLLGLELRNVRYHIFHLRKNAESLSLLGRGRSVPAKSYVDEDVGAAVGDVEKVRTEVRGAERRELFGHRLPSGLLSKLLHRVVDAMAVGIVRYKVGGLAVLAELFCQNWREGLRRHIGRGLSAEAVSLAILAGGVVGAAVAHHEDDVLALSEF